jgi:hypothetical protein
MARVALYRCQAGLARHSADAPVAAIIMGPDQLNTGITMLRATASEG